MRAARAPAGASSSRVVSGDLHIGPDGVARCWWAASAPECVRYHDEEWGRPLRDEDALYERLCLEGSQSGLAWITILRAAARRSRVGIAPRSLAVARAARPPWRSIPWARVGRSVQSRPKAMI